MSKILTSIAIGASLLVSACSTTPPLGKDYTALRAANPRSILVVPVINHSNETEAADLFLTTLPVLLGERGYYVFPTNLSKKLIEDGGLSDPQLVHSTATPKLASLFGADAILYLEILEWKTTYAVLSAGTQVKFLYTLKDGRTNNLLWQDERTAFYSSQSSSGNILADLIATAIVAAMNNANSDYTPVAMLANGIAISTDGQGLPFGPYSPARTQNEVKFPANGSGSFSNATLSAVSFPVDGKELAGKQAPEPVKVPKTESIKPDPAQK